jgi:hypothetical protein
MSNFHTIYTCQIAGKQFLTTDYYYTEHCKAEFINISDELVKGFQLITLESHPDLIEVPDIDDDIAILLHRQASNLIIIKKRLNDWLKTEMFKFDEISPDLIAREIDCTTQQLTHCLTQDIMDSIEDYQELLDELHANPKRDEPLEGNWYGWELIEKLDAYIAENSTKN